MDYGDNYWGLYRDYYRDPFPHSLLSTREYWNPSIPGSGQARAFQFISAKANIPKTKKQPEKSTKKPESPHSKTHNPQISEKTLN